MNSTSFELNHHQVGKFWDDNAEAWTALSRKGYDVYRDWVNTPAFMKMLPDVSGLHGLDVGCGEGHNTRLIADRGAHLTAFDISRKFVRHAQNKSAKEGFNIRHCIASAVELPFINETFDFVVATMSLMDLPEHDLALAEVYRVLKPGGFLQFSICHPCFSTHHRKPVKDENGVEYAVECGNYFNPPQGEILTWMFSSAPRELRDRFQPFQIPCFYHTLSEWLNLLIDIGFRLERFVEPHADKETARKCPQVADTRVVAYFLIIRCRKP